MDDLTIINTAIFLSHFDRISVLSITGGEPLMEWDKIDRLLHALNNRGVEIGMLDITTNGVVPANHADEVVERLKQWSQYYDDFSLCISDDDFHKGSMTNTKLNRFHNFKDVLELYGVPYFRRDQAARIIIREGRAIDNKLWNAEMKNRPFELIYINPDLEEPRLSDSYNLEFEEGVVYIDVYGNLISGCDHSYRTMSKWKFGNIVEAVSVPYPVHVYMINRLQTKEYEEKKEIWLIDKR
jgi:organic radical activating enzyme